MDVPDQEEASSIRDNIARNWPHLRRRLAVLLTFFLLLSLVLCAYLFNSIFINIYPGEAGVLWKRFHGGTDMEYVYDEGLHVIPPWNKMYIYDTRIQHRPFQFKALSKDGLPITFEVSVRFFPDREHLPQLHKLVGPDYILKVVKPEVQAHLRKVVANYLPEEIYTSEGYLLQIIMQGAMGAFAEKYINLDNLLIRRMILPKTIVEAIEHKLARQQHVQEYTYRLQIAEKEALRKAIEAEGIKRFQDIVKSSGFFDKYLQYKGIDATVDLAKSDNAKVVVIGGGDGKLPLIMNMASTPAPTIPALPPVASTMKKSGPVSPPTLKAKVKQAGVLEPESSFFSRLQSYLRRGSAQLTPPAPPSPGKE